MEMENLLECEWSVNSGVFTSKNWYKASIGDALKSKPRDHYSKFQIHIQGHIPKSKKDSQYFQSISDKDKVLRSSSHLILPN